jgi:hypothetical protein
MTHPILRYLKRAKCADAAMTAKGDPAPKKKSNAWPISFGSFPDVCATVAVLYLAD